MLFPHGIIEQSLFPGLAYLNLIIIFQQFVWIIDSSKLCDILGEFPLPIEVIPMAQGLVSRRLVQMGGTPVMRERFQTDNGNIIVDVRNLDLTNPLRIEQKLNCVAGIVENGIFAKESADVILVGSDEGVRHATIFGLYLEIDRSMD